MASLGFRTIEEMVGHLDCLKVKDVDQNIDLKAILNQKLILFILKNKIPINLN